MTEQTYNKDSLYKDMNKYFLAAYALQKIEEKSPEGEIAAKAHLLKASNLEKFMDEFGLGKTPMEAIEVHSQIYARKMNELKIEDALGYFKAPKEMKEGFSKYSGKKVNDLYKGFEEYRKAAKKDKEAKTETEKVEAFRALNKYKGIANDYSNMIALSNYLNAEKAASIIASYQRKELAKQYAKK